MAKFNIGDRVDVIGDLHLPKQKAGMTLAGYDMVFPNGWVVVEIVGGENGTVVECRCVPVEPNITNEEHRDMHSRLRYFEEFLLKKWTDVAKVAA